MPALRLQKKRFTSFQQSNAQAPPSQQQISGAKQIQRLIKPKVHLWLQTPCDCKVCDQQKPILQKETDQIKQFKQSSKKSHQWLKKILLGLTQKMAKTLKIFIPDIMFVSGDGLEIFSTNKKDYRILKFAGTTPIKAIYNTMTRLRKQYKSMLEQNFRKTMIDTINPKFMHIKYYDKLLPSHFHDGDGSRTLSSNKSKFKTYILHNNQNYIISAIEQHKMNEKQPFATLRYVQGNYQLLNQKQFQMFSIMKLPEDVVYVQSYIKSKETQILMKSKQSQAIVISEYTENPNKNSKNEQTFDYSLFKSAETYVMILLGGLGKYDQGYDQLQNLQDESDQLMKQNPPKYAKYITYQIVHFLAMASNIYIRHIKIKWVINDIDNVYLQEIIQFDTDDISKRPIRYKLPPSTEVQNFYQDANFFVQVHKEMKRRKDENLVKIKKQLEELTYQEILEGTNSSLVGNTKQQQFDYSNNPQYQSHNNKQTTNYLNSSINNKDYRRLLSSSRRGQTPSSKDKKSRRYNLQQQIQNLNEKTNNPCIQLSSNSITFDKNKQSITTYYESIYRLGNNNSKSLRTSRRTQHLNNNNHNDRSSIDVYSARKPINNKQDDRKQSLQQQTKTINIQKLNKQKNKFVNYKRRSISSFGFGEIITRYGRKLTIENQKKQFYQSLGRYRKNMNMGDNMKSIPQKKQKVPFGFHITEKKDYSNRNTIDSI